jgi:hypothetical protein
MTEDNQTVALAIRRVSDMREIVSTLRHEGTRGGLVAGVDYGMIPGTGKHPTLLLPGMEKFCRALNAEPEYHYLDEIRDWENGFFAFEFECTLRDVTTAEVLPGGRGVGSCNSRESGFAWRWVQLHDVPAEFCFDGEPGKPLANLQTRTFAATEFTFAVDEAKTSGEYSKPQEYWDKFKDAIENGTAVATKRAARSGKEFDAWAIEDVLYRIPNPDIYDQVNAILKRAKKRALGDAVKGAANVSEYFTVDLEDNATAAPAAPPPAADVVVDADFEDVTQATAQAAPQRPEGKSENQRAFEQAIIDAGFDLDVVAALFDFPEDFDGFYHWMVDEGWDLTRANREIVDLAIMGNEWFTAHNVDVRTKKDSDEIFYSFDVGFGSQQRATAWTRDKFREAGVDVSDWEKVGKVRISPPAGLRLKRNDKGFLNVEEVAATASSSDDEFVE